MACILLFLLPVMECSLGINRKGAILLLLSSKDCGYGSSNW